MLTSFLIAANFALAQPTLELSAEPATYASTDWATHLAPVPRAWVALAAQDERQDEEEVPQIKEPETKVSFPAWGPNYAGERMDLLGTAVRTKTIFGVKVYAYGLFVDPYGAQEVLADFGDKSAKQLEKDDAFYAALLEDNFAKCMRMVFVRNVSGEDVQEAFDKDLGPRIKRAKQERDMPDATEQLEQFKTYFSAKQLKKDSEILFYWEPGGTLVTFVNGERKEDLESPALCWAIYDIFLGEKPIMKKGKRTVIGLTPEVLDRELPEREEPQPEVPTERGGQPAGR
jgi:hypothetical protein